MCVSTAFKILMDLKLSNLQYKLKQIHYIRIMKTLSQYASQVI